MKLTLGFSPCPNDTFIFDAMIHQKIDTEGLSFEVSYEDVETLNQKTFKEELDISKLSFHAYAYAIENYVLLDAGSALGFGVGPLLICNNKEIVDVTLKGREEDDISDLRVAIPGKYTTANFLLGLAFPKLLNKVLKVFSEIEPALLTNEVDLGLIIHENRFTYQNKGLIKVMDLGDFWEKETGCPIPLGGIVIKRRLSDEIKAKVNRILKRSVEYAFEHPKSGIEFIRKHAQEMSEEVMYKHIDLYVNKYSLDLGQEGKQAVQVMFEKALSLNLIPSTKKSLFLDQN